MSFFEKIVYAPFGGQALEVSISATKRSIISEGRRLRIDDDLQQVRDTSSVGSFIVMAVAPASRTEAMWAGALPVSIDGSTGVLRTRLVGDTGFDRIERRTHIAYDLVGTALNHLADNEIITHVRVEAPYDLQDAYLVHGLAIGATVDLATVRPIREGAHAPN